LSLYSFVYIIYSLFFFFLILLPPPTSTLFPYTTLFRSITQISNISPTFGPPGRKQGRLRLSDAICARVPPQVKQKSAASAAFLRSEEHTSELQSPCNLVCRLLLEKKKKKKNKNKINKSK